MRCIINVVAIISYIPDGIFTLTPLVAIYLAVVNDIFTAEPRLSFWPVPAWIKITAGRTKIIQASNRLIRECLSCCSFARQKSRRGSTPLYQRGFGACCTVFCCRVERVTSTLEQLPGSEGKWGEICEVRYALFIHCARFGRRLWKDILCIYWMGIS